MGNSCCVTDDIIDIDFDQIIKDVNDEYQLYMQFLYKLKSDLNSSIFNDEKHSNNNINNQAKSKEFYIIPRNWFENWEKRIENIIKHNKSKSFDFNFKVRNFNNLEKYYFDLFSNELWVKINRNKLYKINERQKFRGLICNNLIIFDFTENSYYIEIFFFDKDEDLFFTDLLFSFDKCDDKKKEYNNLLNLLQTSPIHEIFGNMHYDYSEEFYDSSKKLIVYNKTGKASKEIKDFREEQFEIFHSNEKEKKKENEKINEENINNVNKESNDNNNNNFCESYKKINKNKHINQRNEGNNLRLNEISRASTNMMVSRVSTNMMISNQNIGNANNNNNTINNISNIKLYKAKETYENDQHNCDNLNNNIIIQNKPTNCKMNLLNNNESEKIIRNKYLKSCKEASTLMDCRFKGIDYINGCNEEINKSVFESIIYCLFNIKELTNFVLNKKSDENLQNSFYNNYFNIVQFLSNKKQNIAENENNLLKDCPNYNYQDLLQLIIYQDIDNPISMIINKLHTELNSNKNKENTDSYNKEKNNHNYEDFLKKCKENNNSIIFDLFYGIKKIKTICDKCHKVEYEYEIMNILEFTDEIAKSYKEKENSNNIIQISVEDCLNYYKNSYSKIVYDFQFCKKHQDYNIFYEISKYPQILIIEFNYENKEIFKIKINIELNISNDKYELIGIISIKNKKDANNEDNIFISYCKEFLNEKWLFYDESKVVDFNLNENINNIEPIVLFYKKIN